VVAQEIGAIAGAQGGAHDAGELIPRELRDGSIHSITIHGL
jgi:hypothetical protein